MKLIDALNWRYATKKMNGQKVPAEKLNTILEATRLAPSSFGLTPYRIILVEDEATKALMSPHCYNQPQIIESGAILVFAAKTEINASTVDAFVAEIAEQRGVPVEALKDYEGYMKGAITPRSAEDLQIWAAKQTYIALGFALVAAATEQVDATPMEGFNPDGLDEVLGLKALGLHASVILPLGYRDAANDYLSNAKKVRTTADKLIIKK